MGIVDAMVINFITYCYDTISVVLIRLVYNFIYTCSGTTTTNNNDKHICLCYGFNRSHLVRLFVSYITDQSITVLLLLLFVMYMSRYYFTKYKWNNTLSCWKTLVGWLVGWFLLVDMCVESVVEHQMVSEEDGEKIDQEEVELKACHVGARCRREIKSGTAAAVGGVGVVIVCVVARALRRMIKKNTVLQRELKGMHQALEESKKRYETLLSELRSTKNALEDMNREVEEKDAQMSDMATAVEEKAKALKEQEQCLEKLKGELGLSKSTISMVERELKATKQLLASYQGQADQAHVLRESNRENVATPGSLGIASLWV